MDSAKKEGQKERQDERHQEKKSNLFDYSVDYSDVPMQRRRGILHPAPQKSGRDSRKQDIVFFAVIGILLVAFGSFFTVGYYKSHQRPLTIEELHDLNFKGKLKKEQGYVYKGVYSFVRVDGFWYTALQSQSGRTSYSFAFRYSPNELDGIPVRGILDNDLFNNASEYYITFNPTAQNLSYTVLAVNDYNQHMLNVFGKTPIPACDRNETAACWSRPIITCEEKKSVVVYVRDSDAAGVDFSGNCITISGRGFDQVRGVDRVLYKFYNIMD